MDYMECKFKIGQNKDYRVVQLNGQEIINTISSIF